MTAPAIITGLTLVLLAPLIVAALRQRTLLTMASRNISRRRSEALLIVGGALLGTAIITSSLVVGDVIEGSLTDAARTRYGPIDITVTPADGADLEAVASAVEGAAVEGIDGLLTATTTTATLEALDRDVAVPEVRILEVDLTAAREFGADPRITGISDSSQLGQGEVLLNDRTAQRLGVQAGARLRLHAHGTAVDVTVTEVAAEIGLAGYGGAVVAPGTIAGMVGTEAAAPPRAHLLVSLDGGVFDTRDLSDVVVADLRAAVADLSGVVVEGEKASVLDAAERDGSEFTGLFTVIGSFSVLAGILLLVNLFVMLAEERKTELGMLRAVGFTRRRLSRAFAIEAAIYALVASAVGAVVGIGIGWLVAVLAGSIFGVAEPGSGYRLVIEPASLAIGATTGLAISLVTVWATSVRIARLNIIRAIRDLPEPRLSRMRLRTLVLGGAGILGGAALATVGYLDEHAVPLLLGVPVAAFAVSPLVRRVLPDRTARIVTSAVVLAWALAVTPLFPGIMGTSDEVLFVLQAVVLTAGAVSLAGSLDRVWSAAIERLGRGGRGLAPRLGVAYPLARRFRTSMLLGMFSLVILTVTLLAAMSASFERNTSAAAGQAAGGFDILVDTNPANPIDTAALRAHAGVSAVAGLARGAADFDAAYTAGTRVWPITGIDADLLDRGTPGLLRRGEAYSSDAAAFRAVLDDPALAIVSDVFLTDGQNGTGLDVGDSFAMIDPASGRPHELTIAAVNEDWLGNGVIVSREVTAALLGGRDTVSRTYVAVADGADPENVAAALNATFLAHGADAHTFGALMSAAMRQMTSLLSLLQGFLGLGLLIGIAGLGVVMIRAVRERRQEIGMLRAMGCRAGLVRTVMLSEAGLIAAQGTVIGAVLGLITARQLLVHTFGDIQMPFVVPWPGLLVIVTLPLAAALAATAWPASRAAAIRPAVALRVTD